MNLASSQRQADGRLAIVTTVDSSLAVLFEGYFEMLAGQGYAVTGICSPGPWTEKLARQIRLISCPMERGFAPWRDLRSLIRLYRIFRRERFDLIHYNTPKAALLAALAGRAARCRALLYTIRGQGYAGFKGWRRLVGLWSERWACRGARRVICISDSLREALTADGVAPRRILEVLGQGSSRGVDLHKYRRDEQTGAAGRAIRKQIGAAPGDVVIGLVGRLTMEKGIAELLEAVAPLRARHKGLRLVLIGHEDQRAPLPAAYRQRLTAEPGVHLFSFTDRLEDYYAAMDIVVLPSYREGFGNALIEASAMELPVVASDIPGCRDAVWAGQTGLLTPPHDAQALEAALEELISSPQRRHDMGQTGRRWVEEHFDRNVVWARLLHVYESMLSEA